MAFVFHNCVKGQIVMLPHVQIESPHLLNTVLEKWLLMKDGHTGMKPCQQLVSPTINIWRRNDQLLLGLQGCLNRMRSNKIR